MLTALDTAYSVRLQSTNGSTSHPPAWAVGEHKSASWYHENEYREQWVAKLQDGNLLITGLDIGWKVYVLNKEQVERAYESFIVRIVAGMVGKDEYMAMTNQTMEEIAATVLPDKTDNPLSGLVLDTSELLWFASVLDAAKGIM